MTASPPTPRPSGERGKGRRWLASPALLAGAVCAFVGCCLAGRLATAHNCFADFRRFHHAISPRSLFCPTASQVLALGRDRLARERIAVIVGGSSVLRGCGQRPGQVWSERLQQKLGERYRVLNLAMDGGQPAEFGGTAAEMLARDFPRLIFVTDIQLHTAVTLGPLPADVRPAVVPFEREYGYFFWDAYFKGLIPADAARAQALRAAARKRSSSWAEQMRGLRLDGLVYSRDLWTALACTRVCTFWAPPPAPSSFLLPRGKLQETDQSAAVPSLEELCRRAPAQIAEMRLGMRAEIGASQLLHQHAGSGRLFPGGTPLLVFPPDLDGRTLVLVRRLSPRFVDALKPVERSDYRAAFPLLVRELARFGIEAVAVEARCSAADFIDHCHLTESGGEKLAEEVAPAVRRLARRLGYVP